MTAKLVFCINLQENRLEKKESWIIKGVRYEWRLLKLHFGFSIVLLSFLIVGILLGHVPAFGVLIDPVLMELNALQFRTTLPGRLQAIARAAASQGQAQKLLSYGHCEQN